MIYGLWEPDINTWLGDENGPFVFDSDDEDPLEGEIRAIMTDVRKHRPVGTTVVRRWASDEKALWHEGELERVKIKPRYIYDMRPIKTGKLYIRPEVLNPDKYEALKENLRVVMKDILQDEKLKKAEKKKAMLQRIKTLMNGGE